MIEAIVTYLNYKKTYCKSAPESYAKALERLFQYNPKNPKDYNQKDIIGFCQYLQAELPKACSGGDWHTNYSYSVTVFKDFLKFCQNSNYVLIKTPRIKHNPYHAVSAGDYQKILDYFKDKPDNFANQQKLLMVMLLWDTGMRISEALDIKWSSIIKSTKELYIPNMKNDDGRWVFWSQSTHDLLIKFITSRKLYNGESLFTTFEGAMSARCTQRFLITIGGQLKFSYSLSPHCFRQGKAHHMFNQGADIKLVKEVLGHKTLVSTERYLILNKTEIERQALKYLT